MSAKTEKAVNPRDAMMLDIVGNSRSNRDALLAGDEEVLKDLDYELPKISTNPESRDSDAELAAPQTTAPQTTALQEFEQLPGDEEHPDESSLLDVNKEQKDDKIDNSSDLNNTRVVDRDGVSYLRLEINGLMTEIPYDEIVARLNSTSEGPGVISTTATIDAPDTALKDALTEAFTTLVDKGDVDAAVASSLPAIQAATSSNIDEVAMQRIANEATDSARRVDKIDADWATFKSDPDYSKFAESPRMRQWLSEMTEEVQADSAFMEGNSESFLGVFKEAGTRLRTQMIGVVADSDSQAAAVTDAELKIEKKRQMPSAVSSRTARQSAPVETKPPTNSQIISGMKKARGQRF